MGNFPFILRFPDVCINEVFSASKDMQIRQLNKLVAETGDANHIQDEINPSLGQVNQLRLQIKSVTANL